MAFLQKSLADILAGVDPSTIIIDSDGRISSTDEGVAKRLTDLVGTTRMDSFARPDGVQCNCGSCGTPPPADAVTQ